MSIHSFLLLMVISSKYSSEDYSIMYKLKGGNFNGYTGIISLQGGKYLAINNEKCITIIKPCYA